MADLSIPAKLADINLSTSLRNAGALKILIGYPDFPSTLQLSVAFRYQKYVERLRSCGFEVDGFCLTLNPPSPCLKFESLEKLWRQGDRGLLNMYGRLEETLQSYDVFINYTGINLHPRFVEQLPVCTVFQCFDDPESSLHLSQPVASAYDLALVGNIAEVDTYRAWGVEHVAWAPLGFWEDSYNPRLTELDILEGHRDFNLLMIADFMSPYRKKRVSQLVNAFPDEHFYGRGASGGALPAGAEVAFLQRAKLGPNIHNSTGPINHRTFYLPANGVLQICDNKSHLSQIFELDREVAGFDTVEECIEKCRYYLAHDRERREIAAAGWRRVLRDYNERACFARKIKIITEVLQVCRSRDSCHEVALRQMRRTILRSKIHALDRPMKSTCRLGIRGWHFLWGKFKDLLISWDSKSKRRKIDSIGRLTASFEKCDGQKVVDVCFQPTGDKGVKRMAFITPEFPTEITNAGGLANYLGRICLTLVRMGHSVDVFTISQKPSDIIDYQGIRVHRVNPGPAKWWEKGFGAIRYVAKCLNVSEIFAIRREAKALGKAFEKISQASSYDIVQSSDYRLSGMFIRSRPGQMHVVRCSAASSLLDTLESGSASIHTLWTASREKAWLRQVDCIYAPSRFVAEYKQKALGLQVDVVRPPFFLEVESQKDQSRSLPNRYLFHFGNISRIKGSDLIEKALEIAWQTAPDLNMVWAGKLPVDKDFSSTYPTLCSNGKRFVWLGPLEKPELYGILKGAAAVVAPSRCDNLPNNVLESLACGVPVIGSAGASIDEVVEDGVHGELIPIGDVKALAASLLRAWNSEAPFEGQSLPPLGPDFERFLASQKLLEYIDEDVKCEVVGQVHQGPQAVPA